MAARYPRWVRTLYAGVPSRELTVEENCLLQHFYQTPPDRFIPSRRGVGVNFLKSVDRCHDCPRRSFEIGVDELANFLCWCSLPDRMQPKTFVARLKVLAGEFEVTGFPPFSRSDASRRNAEPDASRP